MDAMLQALRHWIRLDTFWCGLTMLPARWLAPITGEPKPVMEIVRARCWTIGATLLEIAGTFVIVLGLLPTVPMEVLLLGALLKVTGIVGASAAQNRAGLLWQQHLHSSLRLLRSQGAEVRSALAARGLTGTEIASLPGLAGDLYQAEVHCYSRQRMLMWGIPFACASGLFWAGDYGTALIILIIGVGTEPMTEKYYRHRVRVVDERMRVGRASPSTSYLRKALQQHENIMMQVCMVSQLPLALFVVRYGFGLGGGLLASFYGITQGLQGLTQALVVQRNRVAAHRASEQGRLLLDTLASPALLLTNERWLLHAEQVPTLQNVPSGNGVVLEGFAVVSAYPRRLPPISAFLPSGKTTLLKAPSGRGKSLLILALAHLVDHTGQLFFVRDGLALNSHLLSRQEVTGAIFTRRESDIDRASRLVDLFKPLCAATLQPLRSAMERQWGHELTEVIWETSDVRIERQLLQPSALPNGILRSVEEMRKAREEILFTWLGQHGLPLHPLRSFGSLSSGERRRVISLVALAWAEQKHSIQLVILDEPLANLDSQAMQWQMQKIREIEALGPALLIVSHRHLSGLADLEITPAEEVGPSSG